MSEQVTGRVEVLTGAGKVTITLEGERAPVRVPLCGRKR